jgi:glycosyltransferase involved in cell wall biosynthesis
MSQQREKNSGVRVAVVIPTHWDFLMGGAQYQAKLLVQTLFEEYGAVVRFFSARASANRSFPDHQVVCVGHTKWHRQFGHFWDYFRLRRALREFAPDVIYQRVACAYTGICAGYAEEAGIPMIWHVAHENDCRTPLPLAQLLRRPHAVVESRLTHRGIRGADTIVAQTNDQVELLRQNLGIVADQVIRNFHALPDAMVKNTDPVKVIWIANLKPSKRPELFLEIAQQLNDCPGVEFVMVGQPYQVDSLRQNFEQKLQHNANVSFLGAQSQDAVNALLDQAHLLVNTSKGEGFSNTFIQAWMRSVPVLTMGVNPDGILNEDSLGGCYASTEGLADAIRERVSNPARLASTGEVARQFAIREFSMKNASELAALITNATTG